MEQMGLFLVVLCSVTAVLSLIALHRMKKLSKQIQKIADDEVRILMYLNSHRDEMKTSPEEEYKPEELIDAVLGEIFP